MQRKSTLVVLAWNHWDLTRRCLDTLGETDLSDAEVLVVDNGSTDETPEGLKGYGWIRVVRTASNLGFVRGNNAGIAAADPSSDIVLLNNDLEFIQRDWLQRLRVCAHASPTNGVVGCRLLLPDGKLLHAGTYILPDSMWGQQVGSLEKDVGQFTSTREVEGVVFACAYIRREVIEKIGVLSEDFQSYFEDTDYCLRAQKSGFKVLVCGEVTLVHKEHGSSDGGGQFSELFQASRRTFRKKWSHALLERYTRDVFWHSIMNFPTGYGVSCRAILRALDRQGVRVVYRYTYGPGTPFPRVEPPSSGDFLLDTLRTRAEPVRSGLSVVYGQADVFQRGRGRRRAGFTMIEVDGFPRDWVRPANRMDEVWVPSEFNRQGFLNSGLKRPIYKIPLGVDPNYFHPGIRGYPNPLGEYVFLSNFEWGERKEPWMLIRVFNQTFSSREPVRLVCKIFNRDGLLSIRDEIRRLRLRDSGGKVSFIFNREFPHYQLGSFYRSADCYISAGRGEGWDMPLMEAMSCGLPTIATQWGAHTEYVNESICFPLRSRQLIPADARCPYYEGFSWADPDPDHLRFLMRYVFEHPDEGRQKGAAASREMAARWTWTHSASKIVARLEELERS
ncbi:MAG TPA: glycosyltransferase [Thermoanaerobaculia bacterium]